MNLKHSLLLAAGLAIAALTTPAMAQTKWDLPAAYPADNPHSENLSLFAKDVAAATGGKLTLKAEIVHGKLRFRAQLLSEDGRDEIREDVIFDCDDLDSPRQLARQMLDKAPDSIRSLFAAA